MTAPKSLSRILADVLVRHAGKALPASFRQRQEWSAAMQREQDEIAQDREALFWAFGCLFASYSERIRAMNLVDAVAVRALLIVFIAVEALSNLFATVATIAYKTGRLGVVGAMGGQMPGDDYRPFIPLMNAIPWWVHALWVTAAMFYVVSAGLLVTRHRATAFPAFLTGFALALVAKFASGIVIAEAGLQPVASPAGTLTGRLIQAVPEFILPLAIVLVLFLLWRSRTSARAPA
jgi:hypothetical protein